MSRKKMEENEIAFTEKAWELASQKASLSEFDIEKAGLEIVGYFQKKECLPGEMGGLKLRRIRGMVFLILEELSEIEKHLNNKTGE